MTGDLACLDCDCGQGLDIVLVCDDGRYIGWRWADDDELHRENAVVCPACGQEYRLASLSAETPTTGGER